MPQGWDINIVGHDVKPASWFLGHPLNFRVHPQPQQAATKASLDTLGWIDEVLVNLTTQHVLNGHLRISLALRQGEETPVPVKFVQLSEADEQIALAVFDEITAGAVADKEKLALLLHDVKPTDAALQQLLSDMASREGLYHGDGTQDDGSSAPVSEIAHASLADRFVVPPFSVLDARQGYWQERKRAWLALGIQSELGRGENALDGGHSDQSINIDFYAKKRALEEEFKRNLTTDEARRILLDRREIRHVSRANHNAAGRKANAGLEDD